MTVEWTPKYEWPRKKRPMPKGGQTPYGYMDDPEDDTFYWMIPNPEIMPFLEEAMDRISDNGSLREISDWLTVQTKKPITHMGLKKIWDRTCGHLDTPRSRRRAQSVADIKKAAVRERNLTKGRKIAIAKNRLRAQEKKVEKLEQKYKDEETLRQNKLKREEQGLRVNTSSKIALDFEIDGPTTVKTERPVIFEPNPGPQTDFLSTSCLEALYGGSAGGEPKSWFSASFHSNVSK